jgi:hypothetical protein
VLASKWASRTITVTCSGDGTTVRTRFPPTTTGLVFGGSVGHDSAGSSTGSGGGAVFAGRRRGVVVVFVTMTRRLAHRAGLVGRGKLSAA